MKNGVLKYVKLRTYRLQGGKADTTVCSLEVRRSNCCWDGREFCSHGAGSKYPNQRLSQLVLRHKYGNWERSTEHLVSCDNDIIRCENYMKIL